VVSDRIAALGWSHGGSAVLATLDARHESVVAWRERDPHAPYFRAGVAFYPGCIDSLRRKGGYALAAPLTLFVGASDDWTAPGPCIDLARKLASADPPATIFVYPDTYHGFDGPSSQKRLRLEVPNGVHPGQGVTVAPNPDARDDAYARLKIILRRELGAPNAESNSIGLSPSTRP
jgi:dienelactone hydrolase